MAAARTGALGPRGNNLIDKREILAIAQQTSLLPHVVEKDYVLGWMLAGIFGHENLAECWIFKGGTCLKKCFFETYRFSEDHDPTLIKERPMTVHEMCPYLQVENAAQAIAFYTEVFQAKEKFRLTEPSGRIGHAQLDFNGTILMLSDEFPEYGFRAPPAIGGTPVTIHLHVDDADAVIRKAVELGAKVETEPQDQFYGERSGTIVDPFGHRWDIGHSIEELSPEEMQRRYTEMLTSTGS